MIHLRPQIQALLAQFPEDTRDDLYRAMAEAHAVRPYRPKSLWVVECLCGEQVVTETKEFVCKCGRAGRVE